MSIYTCSSVSSPGYSTSYMIDSSLTKNYVKSQVSSVDFNPSCGCIYTTFGNGTFFSPVFFYQNINNYSLNPPDGEEGINTIFQYDINSSNTYFGSIYYTVSPEDIPSGLSMPHIPDYTTIDSLGAILVLAPLSAVPSTSSAYGTYTFPSWYTDYTDGVGYTNAYYYTNQTTSTGVPIFANYLPGSSVESNILTPIIFNSACVIALTSQSAPTTSIRELNVQKKNTSSVIPGKILYSPKTNFDTRGGEFNSDILISQRGVLFKNAVFSDGIIITIDSSQAIFESCIFKGNFNLICQNGGLIVLQPLDIILKSTNPEISITLEEKSKFIVNGTFYMPNVNFSGDDIITSLVTWNITNKSNMDFSNHGIINPGTRQEVTSFFNITHTDNSIFQPPTSNRNFYIVEQAL